MKKLVPIATVAVVCSAVSGFAAGNRHGGGNFPAPAARSSSSTSAPTSTAPRLSGGSRFGNGIPNQARSMSINRPAVTHVNGRRTLNYPAVGVSNARRQNFSSMAGANNSNTRVLRRSSVNSQQTNAGFQRNTTNVQRGNGNFARNNNSVLQRSGGNRQHAGAVNINAKNKLDPQSSSRLRHWNGNVSSTAQAHQNHWNNCHNHHNHHWWRNHCAAIIFWNWGWWGWYDGWWYPAWGYDPYSYYDYNQPIYGYGDLAPEQIVASVQVALQEQGYYQYAIDGQMGPLTREAIARYQRDHRLPITYGIDQVTLGALGIIH